VGGSRTRGLAWALLALVLLNIAVFERVRDHDFVTWDDGPYVTENATVQDGLTTRGLAWAWSAPTAPYWHPLTWMSHMLDVELFGLDAGGHHLTSLAIHIVNTLLLCVLLVHLTGSAGRSAFVAALFAIHPLHVESVAWIAERKDVLSTLFLLLTCGAYAWYTRRPRWGRYAALFLVLGLGLAAKPMLVTLPLLLLLLDIWPLGRWSSSWPRLVLEKLPLVALAIAVGVATYLIQQRVGAMAAFESLPLEHRLANAVMSYVKYILLMVWPSGLAAFYPYPRALPPVWLLAAAIVALVTASVVAALSFRRRPYVFVGWFWYVIALLPVIGIIQVGEQAMADRFTYVPLIGLFVIAAWLLPELLVRLFRHRAAVPVAAVVVIVGYAATARAQVEHWRNGRTLWERALAVTRDNYYAHSALGALLAGDGLVADAVAHQVEALRIRPSDSDAHNELGKVLAEQGKLPDAIAHFRAALRSNDAFARAHHNLGMALLNLGAYDEAVSHFRAALALEPDLAKAHDGLGRALARGGRPGEAVPQFREALRIAPAFVEARYNLALALAEQGETDQAVAEYRTVVRASPELAEARNNLALALEKLGRTEDAIQVYQEALRLWPNRVDLNFNLALLYYRRGARSAAAECLKRILAIEPGHPEASRLLNDLGRSRRP
jgi:tetratricopeptide (TPR) repeat protein